MKMDNALSTVTRTNTSLKITGNTNHKNGIYVPHRGAITLIKPDGTKEDIIIGLPSWGDHHNNRVVFGPDDKMYFDQGTATNSGISGKIVWIGFKTILFSYRKVSVWNIKS